MNQLLNEANQLLKNMQVEYAFCGGYAIELFLNRELRVHGDIDVSVYWDERDFIIEYMKNNNWKVYEMCGNGIAHQINDIADQLKLKRNIFCIRDNCKMVDIEPKAEKDMYIIDFAHSEQTKFDFIEFLFNTKTKSDFCYARNTEITLPLFDVKRFNTDIPYLVPEIVLLYKSTDIMREGYQMDFEAAIDKMSKEQKNWLKSALITMNQLGHPWIGYCD